MKSIVRFSATALALTAALVVGLGSAGALILLQTSAASLNAYIVLVLLSVMLLLAFLAVSFLIAVLFLDRLRSMAASILVWFACVIGYELALIGITSVLVVEVWRRKRTGVGAASMALAAGVASTTAPLRPSDFIKTGLSVDEIAYVAPEQVEGDAPDHRADIFSVGVLAYELLSGRRPFLATSVPALLECILRERPDPRALPRT